MFCMSCVRKKQVSVVFFRFETLRQISSSNSFPSSIEVEGFHPAALGQVHRYPRCEGLLVSSWLWRAVSWVLARFGRSHGGLKLPILAGLKKKLQNCKKAMEPTSTCNIPLTFESILQVFIPMELNLHFRLRSFNFGVASPLLGHG